VDHPPLVPAALVVDDEHRIDVGEDIDEGVRIVGIGGQARLGLEDETDHADRRLSTIAPGYRQLYVIVDSRDKRREHVRFEPGRIQEIVLEQLARRIGLVEHLQGQHAMGSSGKLNEAVFERGRKVLDVTPRLATVFMSCFARGLGWQGGGGWSPGMVLACAGRVARLTIANMETQAMMLAARLVLNSPDRRCVIFPLDSGQFQLHGE